MNSTPAPQRLCWWRHETRPLHQTMKRCGTSTRPSSGKCTTMSMRRPCVSEISKSNVETYRATNGANGDQNLLFKLGLNEFGGPTSQEFAARCTSLKLANLSSAMRAQQFESRLREKVRQTVKTLRRNTLAHKDEGEQEGSPADTSNWEQMQVNAFAHKECPLTQVAERHEGAVPRPSRLFAPCSSVQKGKRQ